MREERRDIDFQGLVRDIAAALRWEHRRATSETADRVSGAVFEPGNPADGDRPMISFHRDPWRGRIRIFGWFPYDYRPRGEKFEISVSEARTPEAIARDIERRLLPKYMPAVAAAVERKRIAEYRKAGAEAVAGALARAAAAEPLGHSPERFVSYAREDRGETAHIEGVVYAYKDEDQVDLKLSCLSPHLARRIIRLCRPMLPIDRKEES